MSDPAVELRERFEILQQRLTAWHEAVVGLATEYDIDAHNGKAFRDPRLEAAEDAHDEALESYHDSAMRVLGLEIPEDEDDDETFLVDDFLVHLVVGVPEGDIGRSLDDVIEIVDDAMHSVVQQLFEAGFTVPEWATGRGELDMEQGPEEEL